VAWQKSEHVKGFSWVPQIPHHKMLNKDYLIGTISQQNKTSSMNEHNSFIIVFVSSINNLSTFIFTNQHKQPWENLCICMWWHAIEFSQKQFIFILFLLHLLVLFLAPISLMFGYLGKTTLLLIPFCHKNSNVSYIMLIKHLL
jgi:hypothetical protein